MARKQQEDFTQFQIEWKAFTHGKGLSEGLRGYQEAIAEAAVARDKALGIYEDDVAAVQRYRDDVGKSFDRLRAEVVRAAQVVLLLDHWLEEE
jgi:hypothetical protein